MKRAVQGCLLDLETTSALERQSAEAQAVLTEERQLVDNYIRVLTTAPEADPNRKEVLQALALSMTRNRIDSRLADLRARTQNDLIAARQARLAQISELETDIRFKRGLRQRLLAALDTPRLTVPEAGRVLRVRRLPKGTQAPEMTQVVELRPEGEGGYRAGFALPPAQRDQIQLGQEVRVTLLGQLDRVPDLTGEITHIRLTEDDALWAEITLAEASARILDDPQTGLALRGSGTASTIHVRGPDIHVLSRVGQTITRGTAQLHQRLHTAPGQISW
jgi:hypothetical protein